MEKSQAKGSATMKKAQQLQVNFLCYFPPPGNRVNFDPWDIGGDAVLPPSCYQNHSWAAV